MSEKITEIGTMCEQTLVVKTNKYIYKVKINSFDLVTKSDIPSLHGLYSGDVWRWARRRSAKVYNNDFLPANITG